MRCVCSRLKSNINKRRAPVRGVPPSARSWSMEVEPGQSAFPRLGPLTRASPTRHSRAEPSSLSSLFARLG
eukprot:5235089-Prymnesium_polylepis.2